MDLAVEEDVEVRGWRATSCCRWESSALAWAEEDDEEDDWRLLVLLVVCRGMAGREWEWEFVGWGRDGMVVAARIECDGVCTAHDTRLVLVDVWSVIKYTVACYSFCE